MNYNQFCERKLTSLRKDLVKKELQTQRLVNQSERLNWQIKNLQHLKENPLRARDLVRFGDVSATSNYFTHFGEVISVHRHHVIIMEENGIKHKREHHTVERTVVAAEDEYENNDEDDMDIEEDDDEDDDEEDDDEEDDDDDNDDDNDNDDDDDDDDDDENDDDDDDEDEDEEEDEHKDEHEDEHDDDNDNNVYLYVGYVFEHDDD